VYRWIEQILEAGLGLLFPPHCAGCGRAGILWCCDCDAAMLRIRAPICEQCGEPIAWQGFCRRCQREPLLLQARSYALYQQPLIALIMQIKYRNDHDLMTLLGRWLAELLEGTGWTPGLVTAVPLGKKRLRERGYNQAEEIASALAAEAGLPAAPGAIERARETRSQVGLNGAERAANVADAFRGQAHIVQDERILLVDDLYTTGATLSACAQALLDAGAMKVQALTVARAHSRVPDH